MGVMICSGCDCQINIEKEDFDFEANKCGICMSADYVRQVIKKVTKGVSLDERMCIDERNHNIPRI